MKEHVDSKRDRAQARAKLRSYEVPDDFVPPIAGPTISEPLRRPVAFQSVKHIHVQELKRPRRSLKTIGDVNSYLYFAGKGLVDPTWSEFKKVYRKS